MRAYLRLDPHFADKKADYPDGAHRAYIDVLCFAEQQPHRGRFRNAKLLAVLLERRARWVPYLMDKGDLVSIEGGKLYVDGWDEWQEGDWKVAERVARIRSRAKTVTPTVTVTVTPTVSNLQGGKAVGGRPLLAVGGAPLPNGGAPPVFLGFPPKKPRKLTPKEIESFRRHARESRDPTIAANARETLEKAGIPVEESA